MTDSTKIEIMNISEVSRNGRIYPRHEIEKAMKEAHWSLPVTLGETWEDGSSPTTVNMEQVAGWASGLALEGDVLIAHMKLYDTLAGNIVNELVKETTGLTFKSRGVGKVTRTVNGDHVVSDFKLISIDVSLPSDEQDNNVT